MKEVIQDSLLAVNIRHKVDVLFGVESGSRAWGFESKDSDYDIRFVYQSPRDGYLTLFPPRDVIEQALPTIVAGVPLDFSGWDLRKFLQLISKSNPVAFEWLQSKIVYREVPFWEEEVRPACAPFFSPKAAMMHYLSMAKHNYREHMRDGTSPSVRLKKYLYITRPLLCCRWIEMYRNVLLPPMQFHTLMEGTLPASKAGLHHALLDLVERKKAGHELDEGPAIKCINDFIDAELARLRAVADHMPVGRGEIATLDRLFCDRVV